MFAIAQKVPVGDPRVISNNKPVPAFLQMLIETESSLMWTRQKDEVFYGVMIPAPYHVRVYKASLSNGGAAIVKFNPTGLVDVKKKIVGRIVHKGHVHAQCAHTYILEHEQNGEIVESWAHKELCDSEVRGHFIAVDEYMPPIKELYLTACDHYQKQPA